MSSEVLASDRRRAANRHGRVIEVFADVTCPFTHVGLQRLVARRHELGRDDIGLWIRSWPLELVQGAPLTADHVGHDIEALQDEVAPDLFAGFDTDRFPTTSMPALMLAAHAYEEGIDQGERVGLLLRQALFEEGRDVSSSEVLEDLAHRTGTSPATETDREQVLADWWEGQHRGVIGSPHFFVDDTSWFCPTLSITRRDGHLRVTTDAEAVRRFADACFS